jgi:flagellar hook assembly protein FlgD
MRSRLTESQKQRTAPTRRLNVVPLVAILVLGAIGATLVLLFPMDWVRLPKVTVNAENTAFSPNGDGNQDTALVMYSLSTDATVTVNVLDASQSPVRGLVEELPQSAGQHTVVWDGLDRLGQVLPDGEYIVQVNAQATVRNALGNVRLRVDTEPPVIRLANMPEDMQVGAEKRDLLIEGVTDPEATVWLNEGYQPVPVSDSGGFSINYPLKDGANRIELIAVDQAGNQVSIVREIVRLTQPPDIVVTNPPDELWINQQMLSVQGSVPPGIQVRVNDTEAAVDEEGNFNVDVVLEEGENTVRIEAIDAVGNVSVEERLVHLRTRAPELSLTNVQDNMTVREPSLLVAGKTQPLATVQMNGRELAVDSQGGFQGTVDLIEGENILRVEAVDRAGNTAVKVLQLNYAPVEPATGLPGGVQTVLAVTGAGMVGVIVLWLISGLWQRPLSLVLKTTRPSISPDFDGRLEPAVVVFELSRPAKVTAEVWDTANRHVATVFARQRRDRGEHLLVWDGRDAEGRFVSPAGYEIEVNATTLFSTVSGSTRVWVEEGRRAPAWDRVRRQEGQYGRAET